MQRRSEVQSQPVRAAPSPAQIAAYRLLWVWLLAPPTPDELAALASKPADDPLEAA
ncbi:MAG: hypothetical protein ACYC3S_13230 [Chloroflexota bacterium]